jgi:hypothetical protein
MPDDAAQLERQNAALTRQLLEWICASPRTYADVLETWRSTCPRHSIWEDALESGLIGSAPDGRLFLTHAGQARLATAPAAPLVTLTSGT